MISILHMGQVIWFFFANFNFHRSLTGQPPLLDFPAPPLFEFEDTIETEVRTPVPENELVEDLDCTMLFPELFSLEFYFIKNKIITSKWRALFPRSIFGFHVFTYVSM